MMAYPGEVQRGDTVHWRDYFHGELEGVVLRCAKDGTWCDVRYPHTPSVFHDMRHLVRRVAIVKLQIVQKANVP